MDLHNLEALDIPNQTSHVFVKQEKEESIIKFGSYMDYMNDTTSPPSRPLTQLANPDDSNSECKLPFKCEFYLDELSTADELRELPSCLENLTVDMFQIDHHGQDRGSNVNCRNNMVAPNLHLSGDGEKHLNSYLVMCLIFVLVIMFALTLRLCFQNPFCLPTSRVSVAPSATVWL